MNSVISYMQQITARALMDEVDTTPKPGLVDREDSGAHTDMNYHTFVASTNAIVPYLTHMAETGFTWSGAVKDLFPAIRTIGIEAEQAMFSATCGINTHKGVIFSLGIIEAAGAWYYRQHGSFCSEDILLLCADMAGAALEQDFASIDPNGSLTHGERLFLTYGYKGIRGEVQSGFSSIRKYSLPLLRQLNAVGADKNQAQVQVLLQLMAQVNDTNVLIRTDAKMLAYVKESAGRILGMSQPFGASQMKELTALNQDFIARNISPGGCADLLAVTIFMSLLEQYKSCQPCISKEE